MASILGFLQAVSPSFNAILRKSVPNLTKNSGLLPKIGCSPAFTAAAGLHFKRISPPRPMPKPPKPPSYQVPVVDNSEEEECTIEEVVSKVNSQIDNKSHGRLFAVIQLANKQWKITPEDTVVIEGFWPPNVGDVIRLEKVLLIGSSDFTLVGMPLLRPDLVNIQATVVEKRLSHTKTNFRMKRRKQYKRINFYRYQHTMIRINSITLSSRLNEKKDIEGIEGRVF